MRAQEFVVEYKKYPTQDYEGIKISMVEKDGQLIVRAIDDWGVNELGSVEFNIGDNRELDPQDLRVDDRYQGQGIARTMYDYVKSLGYTINRSWDQTDAGAGFWNKHRGEDVRVWEQGIAEGENNDTAISLSRLGKFHPGADSLAQFVPERATAQYALHPDKWESTFYSLTNKDSDKLKYYGPKKISIPPGTLVGDMAIANKFYRAKTPEEKQQYAELYRQSLKPYPVDVGAYRMPELLIPKQNMAEDAITEDAVMGKIEQTGKIVRILKKQHTVPFSDEKDWLLIDTDPARGNSGLGLKWIPAHTRFEWVRPYRDTVEENFADGKNPGRKGLSKRVGIPKKATLGQLEKIAGSSTGERRRMAQWQLNMRRGRKNESQ